MAKLPSRVLILSMLQSDQTPKNQDLIQGHYDAIVIGGGMVGATLVVKLAELGKSVLLIEHNPPQSQWLDKPPLRVSAVNLASEKLLSECGIWGQISASSKCQFTQLMTWEQPSNKLVFDAKDINEPHLGHLVRNEAIQLAAFRILQQDLVGKVEQSMASVKYIQQFEHMVQVTLDAGDLSSDGLTNVTADLLFAADGGNSATRQLAGIGSTGWAYRQHCFSITIKTHFPTQTATWQEFQPTGPKAFLPLANGYASLIWYDNANTIVNLKTLNDQQLKNQILDSFPPLPGDFDIVSRASFPLVRRQANQYGKNRVILVGDAAHVINPLAGQGVNLGFQDIATLIVILSEVNWADRLAIKAGLLRYERQRKTDTLVMSSMMDLFYHSFSNDHKPLKGLRNTALRLIQSSSMVKQLALKRAVGKQLFNRN